MSSSIPAYYTNVDECVDAIINKVGKDIVFAMPLGLGKPNILINALYSRAKADPEISLKILTAISLEPPTGKSDMEKKFLGPMVKRLFGNYPPLEYLPDQKRETLPPNVTVGDFFFQAGAFMNSKTSQQNYISSNYTHIARDMIDNGANVLGQMITKKTIDGKKMISLSSNPDVTVEIIPMVRELERQGKRVALVGQINTNLPFMYNDAMHEDSMFDMILDNPDYDYTLFGTPNGTVSDPDYLIGLYASTLIKDGGTLQIGIGSLGDAIVYTSQLRHTDNGQYQSLLSDYNILGRYGDLIDTIGGTQPFEKGLYGSSEMFVNGFLHLIRSGIVKRKVYDNVPLQRLLNEEAIDETVTIDMVKKLVDAGFVAAQLGEDDLALLQKYGIVKAEITLSGGKLHTAEGDSAKADLSDEATLQFIEKYALGHRLKGGILMHGGFFLGPQDFYEGLRNMSEEESKQISMTPVSNVNQLYGGEELKTLQRKDGRFMNTCLMSTLNGAAVSDGLDNGKVVSGVGGQYNFVAMAHALPDGRSIMMLRSTRSSGGETVSNIVWNYGHITIPRILRDIVVTEYGIAQLRGKPDKDVMAELLNITDSRFQDELLAKAKEAGKIPEDYEIPEQYRNNLPQSISEPLVKYKKEELFPPFPFGHDFTEEELVLGKILKKLKGAGKAAKAGGVFMALKNEKIPKKAMRYIERIGLAEPKNLQEKVIQKLIIAELDAGGYI